MTKAIRGYKDINKAKLYRNKQRAVNYQRGNFTVIKYKRYSPDDDWEILFSGKSDREIAKELKRSVRSIQIRRTRLNAGTVSSPYSNS